MEIAAPCPFSEHFINIMGFWVGQFVCLSHPFLRGKECSTSLSENLDPPRMEYGSKFDNYLKLICSYDLIFYVHMYVECSEQRRIVVY